MECFPDAYYIFLWRNPVSTVSSFINITGSNAFAIENIKAELYLGLSRMCQESQRTDRRILRINYEKAVDDPDETAEAIFKFLSLDPSVALRDLGSVAIRGSLGDPGDLRASGTVVRGRDGSRNNALCSPIRKRFMLSYLEWIGAERLSYMGYDLGELKGEVRRVETSVARVLGDCARLVFPKLNSLFLLTAIRSNLRDAVSGREPYSVD
jgi:hypothetical protein